MITPSTPSLLLHLVSPRESVVSRREADVREGRIVPVMELVQVSGPCITAALRASLALRQNDPHPQIGRVSYADGRCLSCGEMTIRHVDATGRSRGCVYAVQHAGRMA